jgi:hypothetical protein
MSKFGDLDEVHNFIWILSVLKYFKTYNKINMGSKCTCLKTYSSEDQQICIEKESQRLKLYSEQDSGYYSLDGILYLQKFLRMYISQRNSFPSQTKFLSNLQLSSLNVSKIEELISIPEDFSNAVTKSVELRLGPYIYAEQENDKEKVQKKPPMKLENSSIYVGEWNEKWERHGKGYQLWGDGSKYEGYWKCDKATGKGRLIHSDGDVYEGDWIDDKANGKGIYIHSDGAYYEGTWTDDRQHGKGHEVWPDGSSYKGCYVNGQKSGFGVFTWTDGSSYEGDFLFNNIHGQGKYSWSDGRVFIGEWANNKMHGKGEFKWPDGRKYYGDYVNDKKQGFGIFEWPDNKRYEGQWNDGKQHGKGILYCSNGDKVEGMWVEGKRCKV